MTAITGTTFFHRPVDLVFDFLADPRNEPKYNPIVLDARKITGGPIGPGTRFVQRAKQFGRAGDVDIEIIDYQRPKHLGFRIRSTGMKVHGRQFFTAQDTGTQVRWEWDFRADRRWRLLGPLMGLAGRRLERRVWERMKRYVDAELTGRSDAS